MLGAAKLYIFVHVMQFFFFNRSKDKYTLKGVLRLARSIMKSLTFIGVFSVLGKVGFCYAPQYLPNFNSFWGKVVGGLSSSGVFLESRSRWGEFTMSVATQLPESWKNYLEKQKLWYPLPLGHNLLFGLSMGVISYVYFTDNECLRSFHRKFLELLFGKTVHNDKL